MTEVARMIHVLWISATLLICTPAFGGLITPRPQHTYSALPAEWPSVDCNSVEAGRHLCYSSSPLPTLALDAPAWVLAIPTHGATLTVSDVFLAGTICDVLSSFNHLTSRDSLVDEARQDSAMNASVLKHSMEHADRATDPPKTPDRELALAGLTFALAVCFTLILSIIATPRERVNPWLCPLNEPAAPLTYARVYLRRPL